MSFQTVFYAFSVPHTITYTISIFIHIWFDHYSNSRVGLKRTDPNGVTYPVTKRVLICVREIIKYVKKRVSLDSTIGVVHENPHLITEGGIVQNMGKINISRIRSEAYTVIS